MKRVLEIGVPACLSNAVVLSIGFVLKSRPFLLLPSLIHLLRVDIPSSLRIRLPMMMTVMMTTQILMLLQLILLSSLNQREMSGPIMVVMMVVWCPMTIVAIEMHLTRRHHNLSKILRSHQTLFHPFHRRIRRSIGRKRSLISHLLLVLSSSGIALFTKNW